VKQVFGLLSLMKSTERTRQLPQQIECGLLMWSSAHAEWQDQPLRFIDPSAMRWALTPIRSWLCCCTRGGGLGRRGGSSPF